MITRGIIALLSILIASVLMFAACDVISEKGVQDSLEVVPNVSPVQGAQNASITVNRGANSYFTVNIENLDYNLKVSEGMNEAWCIAWNSPISSNNDRYDGIGVYSTRGDKNFEPINRLFTVKNRLVKNDPGITYKEIQVAIWTLLDHPKFDMNDNSHLSSRFLTDGQPNFDKDRVTSIVDYVLGRSTSANKLFANHEHELNEPEQEVCILKTDRDTQTLIVPCDDTFWAFGTVYNFRDADNGQWGWVFGGDVDAAWVPNGTIYDGTYLIRGAGLDDGTVTDPNVFEDNWIGRLELEKDGNDLLLTYESWDDVHDFGYKMNKLALWVGCDFDDEADGLPFKGKVKNVPPGLLLYKYEEAEPFSSVTFRIDVSNLGHCVDEYQIAAHGNAFWGNWAD